MVEACLRCGLCCYFEDENGFNRKCKYLVKLNSGKTLCRIFAKRLGTVIYEKGDFKVYCGYRENQDRRIDGCVVKKYEE